MVARPGTYQASNNSGELKPELHGRTDLKQFYGGLAYARNIEPVPQGGSRLSPRSRHLSRVRKQLLTITPTAVTSNLVNITAPATLRQLDFGALVPVSVIAALDLSASQNVGAILRFEYWNGAAWHAIGEPFSTGEVARHRCAATAPGNSVLCTSVRLQLFAAPPSPTTFAVADMVAERETDVLALGRIFPFTFSLEQTYTAVLLDRHLDFYRDGTYVGTSFVGIQIAQQAMTSTQQRFDTMLLFHEDLPTRRVLRDGSDALWPSDAAPFLSIPQVDLGGSYSNATVDSWTVYLSFLALPPSNPDSANPHNLGRDVVVSFTVNGEETGGISTGPGVPTPTDGPDFVAFAAAVKTAIEALPSVGTGLTVTYNFLVNGVTITFDGADNVGTANVVAARVVNTGDAAATAAHNAIGKPGGEPLISASAGYAATGQFYQDRLVTAGFRSKRSALLASVTGDYFNLNIDQVAASGAILNNLDTDGAERIQYLARSRHLVIFTSDAEYFVSDRALSKTVTPTIVNSSRNGSAAGIPAVESEGSLIYVSRNNALIYAATYDDVSTSYVSTPISLLASHIASDIAAMALQRASNATDAARLWLVRKDGTMTLGTMLRGESVTAFTRWQTDGVVRSVCVDGKNTAYLLVERTVGGVQELHFERLELGLIFDGTVEQTFGAPVTTIGGLAAHEGAAVWAVADGYVAGPFVVSGGTITLPDAASHVLVGRWTPPRALTLPLPSEVSERVVLRRPKRVHTVKLDLVNTTSVAVGANGGVARNRALARAGDPLDAPQAPVNRTESVPALRGFSPDGQVEITQTKPGQLAWRGITIEART